MRRAVAAAPADAPARCLLGMMLHESGDGIAALRELDAAAALAPRDPACQDARAMVLLALRRAADAESAARAALAIDPGRPRALLSLALALDAQDRGEESIAALQCVLAVQPDQLLARRALARRLLRERRNEDAIAVATHASVLASVAAGDIVEDFRSPAPEAALAILQALATAQPDRYDWLIQAARLLHQLGRSSEALAWSERAHRVRPQAIEPVEMHAVTLLDRGEIDSGLALYAQALIRPDASVEAASRHLILMHYDPAQNCEAFFRAHLAFVERRVQPFGSLFARRDGFEAERMLRVGWLSPRFGAGPVATFLTGLLAAFDRSAFRHCLIPLRDLRDPQTTRLRALADEWRPAHDLDDAALLRQLRDGAYDIVIDLAGHSFGNRLNVIAQRVAPIQLCWLDYFDTTAVPAMDGWISDRWLTPEGSQQRYSERILRLASGRFCYTPPTDAGDADHAGTGPPVFASFNRPAKFNDAVLDAWSEILRRVPDARLELGAALFGDACARARTFERFAARGIAAERLRLQAQRGYAELLAAYRQVDVALDPFPFSGCTTTCDALWMGVPVIARTGATFVERQSASLLQRAGRDEWIAADTGGYIDRAVGLAADVSTIRAGRRALRDLTRARLCDAPMQAREFAQLLRSLWRERCAQESATS
jgi:protein O-GlcNAc transferase